MILLAGAVAWLAITRDPSVEHRRLLGLWRTRSVLVALPVLWSAMFLLARALSARAAARFILVTLAGAIGWVALELAGAAGLVSYPRLLGQEAGETLGSVPLPNTVIRGRAPGDIALAWGLPCDQVEFEYRTDRRGFRNDHDRDGADVYLLGDSILVAGLVPFQQTVTARLEAALQRPVMNISLIGQSVQAECDLFRRAAVPVSGRLVVHFVFEGNDLADSRTFRHQPPAGAPRPRGTLVDRSLARNLELWLIRRTDPVHPAAARFTGDLGGTTYGFIWTGRTMRGFDDELPHIASAMATLRDEVVAGGGRYAVVLVPAKLRVLGPLCRWPAGSALADWREQLSPLPEFLARWCADRAVPYLDLTDALSTAARAGQVPFFPLDTHLNAAGHAVMADALASWEPLRAPAAPPSVPLGRSP